MNKCYKTFSLLSNHLFRPVDSSSLGAFRFLFGIVMLWSSLIYFKKDWIKPLYIVRKFHFTFEWFPWLAPLPGNGMYYLYGVMSLASLFFAFGFFYRFSALVFLFCYTFTFLVGITEYNNHYYFICLIAFLFCFVRADQWMSIDTLWKSKKGSQPTSVIIPYWNLLIFKLQVFIVYFYGGIAKISHDWLRGEPIRHWIIEIAEKETTPVIISKFFKTEFATYFFSYGGFIFDLAIGFLLICRKTRLVGIGLVLIFNLTNNWLFSIGVFPFLMIATTVLFLEPETPRKFIQKFFPLIKQQYSSPEAPPTFKFQKPATLFFCVYLIIQIFLPFRHWLYEGNVSWTEEGRMFAWQMKTRDKGDCRLRFLATDPATGESWPLSAVGHLSLKQYYIMCKHPQLIIQYAHYLAREIEKNGIKNPKITARTLVSFNYRPPQPLIDPEIDLAKETYSTFSHARWILPLKE